ncbi:hypothetical protein KCU83_g554, partial [Aureobasidium melanogenum]
MPIDIIHPHISHNDNCFIINPAIYRTNLLQFLQSCITGGGNSNSNSNTKSPFRPQQQKPLSPSSSDIVLMTTGPQTPNITLTPSPAIFASPVMEKTQDKRFLRLPRVEVGRRRIEKERLCERDLRCRCVRCGKRRSVKIAAIKRRRQKRNLSLVRDDGDEGERSEIEG